MKIYVVNFSSKAVSREVTCYCPFPVSLAVWGDAASLHQAGLLARLLLGKGAFGCPQLSKSLWQQYQGEPDTSEAACKYEATKDRPSMQTASR